MDRRAKFRRMFILVLMTPVLQLLGKEKGFGIPIGGTAKAIHHRQGEELRDEALSIGFSVTYNPAHYGNHRVEVLWSEDHCLCAYGPTLAVALNDFRLRHRNKWMELPDGFCQLWLKTFQRECAHAEGTYFKDNPLIEYCSVCHKSLP